MGELTVVSFQASSMHEELAKNPERRSSHRTKRHVSILLISSLWGNMLKRENDDYFL
jgi:hypothetical protein